MVHHVQPGALFIREGLLLPEALEVESERYSDTWRRVIAPSRRRLDGKVRAAGWNLFFQAGLARATALGSSGVNTTGRALKRLLTRTASHDFNSLEVTAISPGHFLGVPYTTVSAHSRHLQEGWLLASPVERKRVRKAADWAAGAADRTRSA